MGTDPFDKNFPMRTVPNWKNGISPLKNYFVFTPIIPPKIPHIIPITIIANDNLAWFIWNQNFKYYWSDVSTCTTNENSYTQSKNFDSYVIGSTTMMWAITKSDWDGQKYLCIFS